MPLLFTDTRDTAIAALLASTLSKWTQLGVQLTISAQKQRANQGGLIGSQASGLRP